MPAQPQAASLASRGWGAESVPRKNFGLPEVAAARRASRCRSRLATGQAVKVRPKAALEQGVAVDVQVVGGDRGGQRCRALRHELRRIGGGDVLEHHLQARVALQQWLQMALDEHRLAIEDVHRRVGHLAVDQQRHADALHRLQGGADVPGIAHAGIAVGGGTGRVELGRREDPLAESLAPAPRAAGFR